MTHKETIDVPDGMTIDSQSNLWNNSFQVFLKPLPPPEPAIEPCPFCGHDLGTNMTGDGKSFILFHEDSRPHCPIRFWDTYPTRLAAIQAANRRAP